MCVRRGGPAHSGRRRATAGPVARAGLASVLVVAVLAAAVMAGGPPGAVAELLLPPGSVVAGPVFRRDGSAVAGIATGADANAYLFSVPPTASFRDASGAAVVHTGRDIQLVRFYTAGVTSPLGSFVVRPDVVRGLSPEQVRDVLALPYLPDSLTIVRVPAGTCVLSGTAGPITGSFPADPPAIPTPGPWGRGGGEQSYLIGRTASADCAGAAFLPGSAYVNRQPIGDRALAYAPAAGGGNAGAVAGMLDALPAPVPYGDLAGVYDSLDLLNIGDPAPLRSALGQISGEGYAGFATVELKGVELFSDRLLDRLAEARGAGDPAAGSPLRAWLSGFGGRGEASGGGGHDVAYGVAGTAFGVDYRVGRRLVVGAGLGYARAGFDLDGLSDSGSVDTYAVAVYAGYARGPWHLDGALGYAAHAGELARSIVFPGVQRLATGDADAGTAFAAIEAGHGIALHRSLEVTPFLRLRAATVFQDGVSETGAGALNLAVQEQELSSVRGILGGRLDWLAPLPEERRLRLTLRAGWAHEYADGTRDVTAGLAGQPGGGFTVEGAEPARDSAVLGLGARLSVGPGVSLAAGYDAELAAGDSTHAVSLGLAVFW